LTNNIVIYTIIINKKAAIIIGSHEGLRGDKLVIMKYFYQFSQTYVI